MTVRTRFAPSPTGQVHIGNIRAAIYNWLFARHHGGRFLLRIEDTDRVRSTDEAVQAVLEALTWLGLEADEPPVYQSRQQAAHRAAAEQLLSSGRAYRAAKGEAGQGEVVLFRMPDHALEFTDEIKGPLRKAAADMQDFVLVRSDGTPVFHLANVVDDVAMGITHVIRGDDHIENTYRHVALYQALGAPLPRFAHLPMIVNAQGKPYSKRDGAAYVGDFRSRGFLADALFNYLVLLGWSPGDDREIMSRAEMIADFSLERVQSKAAQFDERKLAWFNGQYVRALPLATRVAACADVLRAHGIEAEPTYLAQVVDLLAERLQFITDIPTQAAYFFTEDYPVDAKAVRKRLGTAEARERLAEARAALAAAPGFTAPELEEVVRELAERRAVSVGVYIHPLRVAASGSAAGPGLFDMLAVLGRERVLARVDRSLAEPSA
ncbi:MAG: glutamate--tRNA ligase [Candidatus Marinimicrobia bacterium]|nr:glutamate--tRNA ligase [Candidatus Neomarinimicrobiota bacterium]